MEITINPSSKKWWIVGSILILVVGIFVMSSGSKKAPPTQSVFTHATRGPSDAVMVIREYSDFQCPACGAAQAPLLEFWKKHQDEVRWEANNFPLPMHRNAEAAANAAECALDQGKYWEFADIVFAKQSEWSDLADPMPKYKEYVATVGGDANKMETCAKAQTHADKIAQDKKDGEAAGITGTPTFFVNGNRFVGGMTAAAWEQGLASIKANLGPRK
jgi:protein-disulfide isomerase